MKNKYVFLFFIAFSFILFSQEKTKLTIEVKGYKNKLGFIQITVYDSEKDFLKKHIYSCENLKIIEEKTNCVLTIPKGIYAISAFHDQNINRKIDFNFFGVPTESYSFSNNIRPKFRAAKFSEAKFDLNQPKTVEIEIKSFF